MGKATQEERLKRNNSKRRPKIISNKILKTEAAEDLRKKLDFHRKLRSQLARKMQPSLSNVVHSRQLLKKIGRGRQAR